MVDLSVLGIKLSGAFMAAGDQNIEAGSIQVIYEEDEEQFAGAKGLRDSYEQITRKVGTLNVATFKERLGQLCSQLNGALAAVETIGSNFSLDSFEVTLDVSAKGEVRLIGSVSSEVKGGVKLLFKKTH